MKTGPPPKPTARRRLEGNPGKRPYNHQEPQHPVPAEHFDEPPAELVTHPIAEAEWRRLAPMLRQARQVTEADKASLLALCLEWDRYLSAMAQVTTAGMVVLSPNKYPMTNPYLSIATKALSHCQRLWSELGLTPASRSRVVTAGPLPAPGERETTVAKLQRQAVNLRRVK